jgi:hypothetical protein
MSIHELLFQWASSIKIQLSMLVWYKADLIIISFKMNLPWYSCKIAELTLSSLTRSLRYGMNYTSNQWFSKQKWNKNIQADEN